MTAYDPSQWSDFALAQLGASAALLGLVFVGMSINLKEFVGTPVLVNDTTNATAIKAFQIIGSPVVPVTILNPAHSGNTTTFSFLTQSGHTHYVEYKDNITDLNWTPLSTIPGTGAMTLVTDSTATGKTRFYRVRSQ